MKSIKISWKNLRSNRLTFFLNVMLVAFGTGMLTLLLLGSTQLGEKLRENSKGIDLVVGAKGSPLQLILSSVYFIDFPTGNISLSDAELLSRNPLVKRAVPLALGDNYSGFRIVGTDTSFVSLHGLKLADGHFWHHDFEVVVGSEVARKQNIKTGDNLYGSHGLTSAEDIHEDHPYVVTGVLAPNGSSSDHLVLTNIESVWKMHGDDVADHSDEEHHQNEREITSLLIQYRSRMAMITLPALINKSTSMQAASPAKESARLFSLIGVGVQTLRWFAVILMAIAGTSIFVSLYNSLKERMYDLAVMRVMGASPGRLFTIVILEGIVLTVIGSFLGLFLGHLGLQLIGHFQESSQAKISGALFLMEEFFIVLGGFFVGIFAALLPAVQAYRSDISTIISKS